jgi:ribosomal protein L20A (L18A)
VYNFDVEVETSVKNEECGEVNKAKKNYSQEEITETFKKKNQKYKIVKLRRDLKRRKIIVPFYKKIGIRNYWKENICRIESIKEVPN